MPKLTATAFMVEPCQYARDMLRGANKTPVCRYVMCCYEDIPGNMELVEKAISEEFQEIRALDWAEPGLTNVTAKMTELLTDRAGFQVMCVPMEDAPLVEVERS